MSDVDDFFTDPAPSVPRDGYDRPTLLPRGVTNPALRVPYARASSLGGLLTDKMGLFTWERRLLAHGIARNEDLAALIASAPLGRPGHRLTDEYIARAMDRIGKDVKADWGTAVHAFTEPGFNRHLVPARMVADVASYDEAMRGTRVLMTEAFIANDTVMAAGTFDHLRDFAELGPVIEDKKTGVFKPLEHAVQLAIYRDGDLYDVGTDVRTPMPDEVNRDWGIVTQIEREQGRTKVWLIDLQAGREAALLARAIMDYRVRTDVGVDYGNPADLRRKELAGRIAAGGLTREAMMALRAEWADVWTPELDAACAAALAH